MRYWQECHPGFSIPLSMDCGQFPEYTMPDPDLPDITDIIKIRDLLSTSTPRYAWMAWKSAQRNDRKLYLKPDIAEQIAWKNYDQARTIALVPAWRRQMTVWITELDNIEDQLSTILWIIQLLGKKIVPIPPGALGAADDVRVFIDAAEKGLAITGIGRRGKAEWHAARKKLNRDKRRAHSGLAKLTIWLRENHGRLLEAAQATNTWFDVGIVLGPIIGYLEEGLWRLAQATVDNYLVAADVLMPDYSFDFKRTANEYGEAIDKAMIDIVETIFQTQIFGYSLDDQMVTPEQIRTAPPR